MKTTYVTYKPYIHPTDGKVDPETVHRDRKKSFRIPKNHLKLSFSH